MLKDRLKTTTMKDGLSTRWLRRRRPQKSLDSKELGPLAALDECKARSDLWSAVIPGILLEDSFLPLQQLNETASIDRMMTLMDRLDGQDVLDAEFDVGESLEIKLSKSFETAATEEDDSEPEVDTEISKGLNSKRTIRWSDEVGSDLETIHSFERPLELSVRVVILLLDPADRKFEFMHCEYATDDKLKISDLLQQIPGMALNPYFRKKQFRSLCIEQTELLNMLPIQDYYVGEGMILTAICAGDNVKQTMLAAEELLSNKMLRRTVRKAKLSGRALQRLQNSQEWLESKTGRKCGKKGTQDFVERPENTIQDQESQDEINTLSTQKESVMRMRPLHEQDEDDECSATDSSDSHSFLSISSIADDEFVGAAVAAAKECEDVSFVLDEWLCDDISSECNTDSSGRESNQVPVTLVVDGNHQFPESLLIQTELASNGELPVNNSVILGDEPVGDNNFESDDNTDEEVEKEVLRVVEEEAKQEENDHQDEHGQISEHDNGAAMTLAVSDDTPSHLHNKEDQGQVLPMVLEQVIVSDMLISEEERAESKAQDSVPMPQPFQCIHENSMATDANAASFVPMISEMNHNPEASEIVGDSESFCQLGHGICEVLLDQYVERSPRNASSPESVIDEANTSTMICDGCMLEDGEYDQAKHSSEGCMGAVHYVVHDAEDSCPFDEHVTDSTKKQSYSDESVSDQDESLVEHLELQTLSGSFRNKEVKDRSKANAAHVLESPYLDIGKNVSEELTESSDTFSELADQDTARTIVGMLEDSWSPEQQGLHIASTKLGKGSLIRNIRNLVLSNRAANRYHRTPPD